MTFVNGAGVQFEKPLWPEGYLLSVVVLSGPVKTGKSHFVATAGFPEHRVCVIDTHGGFKQLARQFPQHRVIDLPGEIVRATGKPIKEVPLATRWKIFDERVNSIEPGAFDIISVDVVTELEFWFEAAARQNKELVFGTVQSRDVPGVWWGAYKAAYQDYLLGLQARCQTLFLCTHIRAEYEDNKRTGRYVAKAKDNLDVVSDLTLWLHRKPNVKRSPGSEHLLTPHYPIPSGDVLWSRLAFFPGEVDEFGNHLSRQVLPDFLESATAGEVRRFMLNPPEIVSVETGVWWRQDQMTDDDRLVLKHDTATAEAETLRLQVEKLQLQQTQQQEAMTKKLWAARVAGAYGVADGTIYELVKVSGITWSEETKDEIERFIGEQLKEKAA